MKGHRKEKGPAVTPGLPLSRVGLPRPRASVSPNAGGDLSQQLAGCAGGVACLDAVPLDLLGHVDGAVECFECSGRLSVKG